MPEFPRYRKYNEHKLVWMETDSDEANSSDSDKDSNTSNGHYKFILATVAEFMIHEKDIYNTGTLVYMVWLCCS
jgi:hypothetical protein